MKRVALIAAVAALLTAMVVGTAVADPVNGKNSTVVPVTCDNGETYNVVVSAGYPGHILGSTSNIIPVSVTVTAIDPDTGEELFSETGPVGKGKKKGLQGDLITCEAAPQTFEDPELGEVTFLVTVEAFLTPRG